MDGYLDALRFPLSRSAKTYGFTLVGRETAVGGVAGLFVSAAAAVHQLLLSLEVAFPLTPGRATRGEEGDARPR
jgi:hypothetical protein